MHRRGASIASLGRYRKKRHFDRTPEPPGRPTSGSGRHPLFVVQQHAARRMHYDFRLELDGTLKSWAVPKGPCLDPEQKRLAVHVEDHPIEYADFEGIIPPKQYGAGTVLLWDRGIWAPQGDARAGYRKGHLSFRLEGRKLRGGWSLIRMRRPSDEEAKEQWLLIKERDAEARSGREAEIVNRLTESVATGRTVGEIAKEKTRVWRSNRGNADTIPADRLDRVPGAVKAPMPDWIRPQLATLADGVPHGTGWLHEIKLDGYRILSCVRDGRVRLLSRNGKDWTRKLPAQANAVAALGLQSVWLDGEVVAMAPDGRTNFQALQNAFDTSSSEALVYCLFDLAYLNGYDLHRTPLIERKRLLAALVADGAAGEQIRYSDHILGEGEAAFQEACRRGLEGLIAKRIDAPYLSGRGRAWLKVKCERRQEFVIGGYTDPSGSRRWFGALLLGFYDGGLLRYAGRVGTGFSEESLRSLHAQLRPLEQTKTAFSNPPTGYEARGVHWVKPELVAEVRFSEWTSEGILRQPSFQGLRQDKAARDIRKERAAGDPEFGQASGEGERSSFRHGRTAVSRAKRERAPQRLSHPDRVLYPDMGLTKRGLARYYESVADWILPHLKGRPLTLVRCPEGFHRDCFYQKHVNGRVAPAIDRIEIQENDGRESYMVADSLEAVLGLVQMGVLELHTWGARRDQVDRPDRMIFDLDPDPSVSWASVVEAAQLMRVLLEELGLVCFVKTTGGKGLHVVAPLQRVHGWNEVKAFAKAVATHMVRTIPGRFTANMSKRARTGKIYLDYLRNARGATAIAAYSTRAKPGAPVSVPLAWDELSPDLRSDHFTVSNVPERLRALSADPWKEYARVTQRLTERMSRRLDAA